MPIDRAHPPRLSDDLAQGLEGVLEGLVREHEALRDLAAEHRGAIARLDAARLRRVVTETGESMQRIARLEERRCELLGVGPTRLGRAEPGQPTVTELCALMGSPRRERVQELAGRLRELIAEIRRRHAAIRRASETLTAHMRGLMQQVAAELSGTGTYAHTGRVEPGAHQIVTALDVRS